MGFLTQEEFSTGTSSNGTASNGSSGKSGPTNWGKWFQALAAELRVSHVELDGSNWWVATERLEEFCAVHPQANLQPDPAAVYPRTELDRDKALVELLRSRLSGLGPVDAATLADDFSLPQAQLETALIALQTQGYAMVMDTRAWCERRLSARL